MVDFLDYEGWLESLELKGWNLKSVNFNGEHTFIKGKARKIRYCLDEDKSLKPEYIEMFKDFGWKLVYKNYNEFLWAMEYKDERPEAFNNMEVLIERNKKYINKILRLLAIYIVALSMVIKTNSEQSLLFLIGYTIIYVIIQVSYSFKDIKFIKVYNKNKDIINSYNARI